MLEFISHPFVSLIRISQFVAAVVIFFYAALMPADNSPSAVHPFLLHLLGNALLLGSTWVALAGKHSLTKIFVICAGLSAMAELAQSLTSSRTTDPIDFVANGLGLLLTYYLCWFIEKSLPPDRPVKNPD